MPVRDEHPAPDKASGRGIRYTIRVGFKTEVPGDHHFFATIVTSLGELKAAAIAGAKHADLNGDAPMSTVEIVKVEDEFEIHPERDLLDVWGLDL